jgi:AcrR family transcriptional regulator
MASGRSAQQIFELLWGTREPPSRGPKPSLSVDRIVEVAINIADAEGLDGLSMRKIAEQLGVTTMSLYRYVPSKHDLVELMLDAIAYPPPRPEDMPAHWRDALHWWAHQQIAAFSRHPWLNQYAFAHPPFGPNNIQWMECAIQAILRSGLPPSEAMAVLLVLTSYTMGVARLQYSLIRSEAAIGIAYEDMGVVYAQLLEKVVADGRHPGLAEVIVAGGFGEEGPQDNQPEDDFEYGLQFILDGIEGMTRVET